MSDYEWETRRVPRPARAPLPWGYRPRSHEVAEFLALEHPQESVGWVLRHHAQSRSEAASAKRLRGQRPERPSPTVRAEASE